ncbi:MAG: zinc dependent phospholipase C family protein [Treponema sp.]|jgi:hypothetical protein|nr:zinc dependent phospholipase C family protein [Treponema sp.]
MPAQILHTLFGEAAIAALYTRIRPCRGGFFEPERIRKNHRPVFILGCQGPDIFYHSQMTRPVGLEYGALLHRRGFGSFAAALLKRALPDSHPKEAEITPLAAYALGFMTHALLDRFCHPYIVYKSSAVPASARMARFAQILPKGTAHAFFERILDVLMLDLLQGMPVSSWDQDALTRACIEPPPGLKELLFETLITGFPERAGKDRKLFQRIENALQDCAAFYRLTDPKKTSLYGPAANARACSPVWNIPLAYLYPEQLPLHLDYLNLGRRAWHYPAGAGEEDTRSFPDIYHIAVNAAGETLSGFMLPYLETGAFPLKEAAPCLGNEGLSIQDESGKPCAPAKTDPLPLDAVLLQQRSLRRVR